MLAAALFVCVLLIAGAALRAAVRALDVFAIPASVAGGIAGLAVIQAARAWPAAAPMAEALGAELRRWPPWLIAVVFAGLLLEHPRRRFADAARGALLAGIYAWIVVVGQIALGLLATWLVIRPARGVVPAFGQLLEAGFAGGHGTAASLGVVFAKIGFAEGLDLGLFVATVGLVYGIVSGIAFVSVGVRRGWTSRGRAAVGAMHGDAPHSTTALDRLRTMTGRMRAVVTGLHAREIRALAMQGVLVGAALGAGLGLQRLVVLAVARGPDAAIFAQLASLPLFIFAMAGGLLLRKILTAGGAGGVIDGPRVKRLVAAAMNVLIVAAIASLRIESVAAHLALLALLLALGAAWTAFALFAIAPRVLPRAYWFELGVLNYGMSTATTAQGMMLLRIVDPDLDTRAAEDYAMAVPLSAPFIGGGVITLALPILLTAKTLPVVTAIALAVVVALFLAGRALRDRGGGTRVDRGPG